MKNDIDSPPRNPAPDRQFEIMQRFVSYQFGSLWWGRDDLIHAKHPQFVERADRKGHPLVSVKRNELLNRMDTVPMLMGTSGTHLRAAIKNECVSVRGITAAEPNYVTYFGSIVKPGVYDFSDLLDGVEHKEHAFRRPENKHRNSRIGAEPVPWHEIRVMHPNPDKPRVNDEERSALDGFCKHHGF